MVTRTNPLTLRVGLKDFLGEVLAFVGVEGTLDEVLALAGEEGGDAPVAVLGLDSFFEFLVGAMV